MAQQVTKDDYVLKNEGSEIERLDAQHAGFRNYLGGNYVAPLRSPHGGKGPKKILELGAGSGAWAAEVAREFPDAEVLAVDIAPITGSLPANVRTEVVDLRKEHWSWAGKEGWDVVHARFLFIHLPNAHDLVKRALELVAPGGYILLEDNSHHVFSTSPEADPVLPAIKRFHDTAAGAQAARGLDASIGEKYEGWVKESGLFDDVGVRRLEVPMSSWTQDPKLNDLGAAIKQSYTSAFYGALPHLPEQMQPQYKALIDAWKEGVNEEGHRYYVPYYFVWGRKKAA